MRRLWGAKRGRVHAHWLFLLRHLPADQAEGRAWIVRDWEPDAIAEWERQIAEETARRDLLHRTPTRD